MEWREYLAKLKQFEEQTKKLPTVTKKITQVRQVVLAYSQQKIPETIPELIFSTKYLNLHLNKHPELLELQDHLLELRQVLIENFGIWHVFSQAFVKDLRQTLHNKTLVLMCGNALLASQLTDVIAVDDFCWQGQDNTCPRPWCQVKQLDALEALKRYAVEVDNIILEWAPDNSEVDHLLLDFLRTNNWQGNFYVIGEKDGATNSTCFWQKAKLEIPQNLNAHHRPFDFINDQVFAIR